MRFLWLWVIVFEQEVVNVVFHGETTCAFRVVPVDVDAGEFCTGPVCGDFVVLLEGCEEVFCMASSNIFDGEVVYDKYE